MARPFQATVFARMSRTLPRGSTLRARQSLTAYQNHAIRTYSSEVAPEPPSSLTDGELKVFNKLKTHLEPIELVVKDVSGGCGSMYGVNIVSPKFEGLSVIKQHKLVNQVLADDIKEWHGMQLKTKAP